MFSNYIYISIIYIYYVRCQIQNIIYIMVYSIHRGGCTGLVFATFSVLIWYSQWMSMSPPRWRRTSPVWLVDVDGFLNRATSNHPKAWFGETVPMITVYIYIYGSQNCSWVLQIIQNIEIQDFWSTHFRKPPYILYHVFASGCKTARVVVHIFLMVVSLSGVSGGGVGVGGWGGCDNVNVDTSLILAFGIFCAVVSRGFRVGGLGCGGGGGCDNVNVDTFLILAFGIF